MSETYAVARSRLLREASAAGWTVQTISSSGTYRPLKFPRITLPSGKIIELRHQSAGEYNGHSSFLDYRNMTLEEFGKKA